MPYARRTLPLPHGRCRRWLTARMMLTGLLFTVATVQAHPLLPGLLQQQEAQQPATASEQTESPLLDEGVMSRLDFAFGNALDKMMDLVAGAPLLLAALLIVLLFSWLGGFISRRLHWLHWRRQNPYLEGLVRSLVRALVALAGVLIALDILNATKLVGTVLGSAGLVGLVIGFAFKDIAENYIASLLLSIRRPFSPGDHVQIDGHEGRVIALTSRATMLMTLDGNELRLPNSLVFKAVILNFNRNPKRRFDFTVTIDGSQSIHGAQELAMSRISRVEGVLTDPAPSWTVVDFAPSGIGLRFFGWVDRRNTDLGKVRSEAIRQVKAAFASAGIESPRTLQYVVSVPAEAPRSPIEPAHDVGADTSVNTDIDDQLAEAQQEMEDGRNLLTPEEKPQ